MTRYARPPKPQTPPIYRPVDERLDRPLAKVYVYMPQDLRDALKEWAAYRGQSLSSLIFECMESMYDVNAQEELENGDPT